MAPKPHKAKPAPTKRKASSTPSGPSQKKAKQKKKANRWTTDNLTFFTTEESDNIIAEPYRVTHRHRGPAPPDVRPKGAEAVYNTDPADEGAGHVPAPSIPLIGTSDDLVEPLDFGDPLDGRTVEPSDKNDGDNDRSLEPKKRTGKANKAPVDTEDPDNADDDVSGASNNLDPTVPPVYELSTIYDVIADKLSREDLQMACSPFAKDGLRVVTMCSGTESPILAMNLINSALVRQGHRGSTFAVKHLASAEIEPFKQAYIHRNFAPPIVFRDVTEFITSEETAHTAFGGIAEQPKDVHILIAGSSCIDYSSLNNSKKKFGDAGQSHDTLLGVANYAARFRPAIVVLENVQGAPWVQIRDYYEDIDYFGVVMYLDSKDFYIPQTRRRGYMVAFDRRRADVIGLDLEAAAVKLVECLESLAQRASSPYSDFIYKDDEPELKLARKETSESNRGSNIDWAACRLRYATFRTTYSLGIDRPLTFWKSGGKSTFSDYAWMNWANIQRERILDTLDINYLAYLAQRHYDMTFKSRFVELSQNVDRDQDRRQWGIVGCITPSGAPWDTRRGGPVFGREVLALQGIPVDDLSLNRETSNQLQDLAGNAMTTTVVGSVIMSAIIASCVNLVNSTDDESADSEIVSMFENFKSSNNAEDDMADEHEADQLHALNLEELCADEKMEKAVVKLQSTDATVDQIAKLAMLSLPLCRCEISHEAPGIVFHQCEFCGHIACSSCYGNPKHAYKTMQPNVVKACETPQKFIDEITSALPPSLKMDLAESGLPLAQLDQVLSRAKNYKDLEIKPDNVDEQLLKPEISERYRKAVIDAIESTVYLSAVKQESIWRVVFDSTHARLELQITPPVFRGACKISCEWLFYAKPDKIELAGSVVRTLLERPFARMRPVGDDLLLGDWQVWDPAMCYVELEIQGLGEEAQASWEQKLGLRCAPFAELKVYPRIQIHLDKEKNSSIDQHILDIAQTVCGEYQLLPDCGTACGSLHVKVPSTTSQDATQFLFLDPKPLQNAYLDRMVIANTHNRLPYGVVRPVIAEFVKAWRPNSQKLTAPSLPTFVNCRIVDNWHDLADIKLESGLTTEETTMWRLPNTAPISVGTTCDELIPLLLTKLPTKKIPQSEWQEGYQYSINVVDRPAALKDYQWLLKRFARDLTCKHVALAVDENSLDCPKCAPLAPALEWHLTRKKKGKATVVKPFENSEAATAYEKALMSRATPITATVHAQKDHAWLVVNINLTTMVHRLNGRLGANSSNGDMAWSIVSTDGLDVFPSLPHFDISGKPQVAWPAKDTRYVQKPHVMRPRIFIRDLWDTQRKALTWLLEVEAGMVWKEWDAEICDAPALNMQLQVEGTVQKMLRSGVIADNVGAGKTTIALALVARGLEESSPSSDSSKAPPSRRIETNATLILVPNNIIDQWHDEMRLCFGTAWINANVTRLKQSIDAVTIEKMQKVKIVLAPWELFNQAEYWSLLSKLCCAPNVPRKIDRAFDQWLNEVDSDLGDIVHACGPTLDEAAFFEHRENSKLQKKDKYFKFEVFQENNATLNKEQKRRLDDQIAKSLQTKPIHTPDAFETSKAALEKEFKLLHAWKPTKGLPIPLHLFKFHRIIVDEFTYPDAQALLAIRKLNATHRWMLSGTPPLTSAESINYTSTLIGTKVTCDKETNFAFSFKVARSLRATDKTYGEEFREKIEKRSPAWVEKRNKRMEIFVGNFIRRNEAMQVTVNQTTEFIVCSQSVLEACIYNKAYQRLMGHSIRFGVKEKPAKHDNDDEFLLKTLQAAMTPAEALLSCHANFVKRYFKPTDIEAIDSFLAEAMLAGQNTLKHYMPAAREACWYWYTGPSKEDNSKNNSYFPTFIWNICNRTYADPDVAELLDRLTGNAQKTEQKPELMVSLSKKTKKKYDEFTEVHTLAVRRKEMQDRATDLNDTCMRLLEQYQQIRLLKSIKAIASGQTTETCSKCAKVGPCEDQIILGKCGHLVCKQCLAEDGQDSTDVGGCPVIGCLASIKGCQIPTSVYAPKSTATLSSSSYGTKADAIVAKVQSISQEDCILIFVQFDAHRDQLMALFTEKMIRYVDGTQRAAQRIPAFIKRTEPSKRILFLQIDSADSAGWNLQCANHVIFVTPFLAKTQYDYDATTKQAIGRAFRHGQKKDVKVYYFLTSGSMDVNVVQAREKKRLVKKTDGEYGLVSHEDTLCESQEDLAGPSLDTDSIINVAGDEDDEEVDNSDGGVKV